MSEERTIVFVDPSPLLAILIALVVVVTVLGTDAFWRWYQMASECLASRSYNGDLVIFLLKVKI